MNTTSLMLQLQYSGSAAAKLWQTAYVHMYNGIYISTLVTRLITRYWPKPVHLSHLQPGRIPQ